MRQSFVGQAVLVLEIEPRVVRDYRSTECSLIGPAIAGLTAEKGRLSNQTMAP